MGWWLTIGKESWDIEEVGPGRAGREEEKDTKLGIAVVGREGAEDKDDSGTQEVGSEEWNIDVKEATQQWSVVEKKKL